MKKTVRGVVIPGLPEEISLLILARLHFPFAQNLSLVCKRWHHIFTSEDLKTLRQCQRLSEPFLFDIVFDRTKPDLYAISLKNLETFKIPTPSEVSNLKGGFHSVALDGYVYIIGGVNRDDSQSQNFVWRCDVWQNKWKKMSNMKFPRAWFAACTMNKKINVIGGWSGRKALSSWEIYDPTANAWQSHGDANFCNFGVFTYSFKEEVYIQSWFNNELFLLGSSDEKICTALKKLQGFALEHKGLLFGLDSDLGENRGVKTFNFSSNSWEFVGRKFPPHFCTHVMYCQIFAHGSYLYAIDRFLMLICLNVDEIVRGKKGVEWKVLVLERNVEVYRPSNSIVVEL